MENESTIRVIVLDDHDIVLTGVKLVLSRHHNCRWVGSAKTVDEGLLLLNRVQPDVAILDFTLPSCGGPDAIARLKGERPNCELIVYSGHSSADIVLTSLRSGALGYVCKSSAPGTLIEGISAVAKRKRFIDPTLVDPVLKGVFASEIMPKAHALAPREKEVLIRVAMGHSSSEIGIELCLSKKTVESYRTRACEKLNLPDRPAIIKFAYQSGWFETVA